MDTQVNIAYYRKEDWQDFLNSADDVQSLHKTWEEWHIDYSNTKLMLSKQGYMVVDVIIDIDNLIKYCKANKLKNVGKTRSEYVNRL